MILNGEDSTVISGKREEYVTEKKEYRTCYVFLSDFSISNVNNIPVIPKRD